MKKQRYFSKTKLYMRERERHCAPRSNVLTTGFSVANTKCSPEYSAFIAK